VPLFDNDAKLIAGKFRIPFRNVPIKPFLHASELQRLEKVYSDAGPPDSCNSTTTPKSESGGHLKKLIKLLTISTNV
jgi:hypothetical protein